MTTAEKWVVIFLLTIGLVLLGQISNNTGTQAQTICAREITPTGMVDIPCS